MAARNCEETLPHISSKLVGSIPNRFSTSIDQKRLLIRRSRLFKERSQRAGYPIMVKCKLRIGRLLTKNIKNRTDTCRKECPQQDTMQQVQEYPSLIDEMPQAPHNTTQYIIQNSQLNNDFPLNTNLRDGFCAYNTSTDSIDNHGMLGSMRGILSFKNTFLFKATNSELMDSSRDHKKEKNNMDIERNFEERGSKDELNFQESDRFDGTNTIDLIQGHNQGTQLYYFSQDKSN